MKPKVFVSYAKENLSAARQIYHLLQGNGYDPWIDEQSIMPGRTWEAEIEKAIRGADCIVVCLSSQSVSKRGYVQKELKFAQKIFDQIPEGKVFIIPIRLDKCNVPYSLGNLQWLDWFSEGAEARLLNSLEHFKISQDGESKIEPLTNPLALNGFELPKLWTTIGMMDLESKVVLIYVYRTTIEKWQPLGMLKNTTLRYRILKYKTREGVYGKVTIDNRFIPNAEYDLHYRYRLGDTTHSVRACLRIESGLPDPIK